MSELTSAMLHTTIITSKNSRKNGNAYVETRLANAPKSMGEIIVPVYANENSKPVTDWDTSAPKFRGVRKVSPGKTGATPQPIKNKPTMVSVGWPAISSTMHPRTPKPIPNLSRVHVDVLFESMTESILPTVRPRKYSTR